MSENRRALGSDLAKDDAHEIRPHEYDDAPEFTDEMFDRATLKIGGPAGPAEAGHDESSYRAAFGSGRHRCLQGRRAGLAKPDERRAAQGGETAGQSGVR